jgi:uncharacterized protein (DUF1015 family)
MSEDFNPMESDRPPRSEGFQEETDRLKKLLYSRGDQRIGQLLINAVSRDLDDVSKEAVEQRLWNIEDDNLVDAVEELLEDVDLLEEGEGSSDY